MAYGAVIPLAGKILPWAMKAAASPWGIRGAAGAIGAAPSLMQGDLGGALIGGGLGAASTIGLGGTLGKLGTAGAGATAQAIGRSGWGAKQGLSLAENLAKQELGANIASAAIPLAGAGIIGGVSNRLLRGPVQGGANRAMGSGSGIIGYNAVTGEPITAAGQAVPGGLGQFGGTNMYGSNPYDVIDPAGAMAANRLMSRKQAEVTRDNINTLAPTQLKWFEETKRRDLERQLASAGIRQNIITQAQMLQNAQTAGLNQATNALSQVGGAMANNYSYS